jgi:hypothetical protein
MQHTNGGYIDFIKDGFKISNCHGCAEIEQTEIKLERGVYYLKYDHEDSDIKSYVFLSNDVRVDNEEKNILKNGMFIINKPEDLISIKFKGTKGIIRNIAITTAKDNSYVRTSPDIDNVKIVKDSKISLFTNEISKFTFKAIIDSVPLSDDYFVIENNNKKYNIDDFNIATRVEYRYEFDKSIGNAGILNIYNPNNVLVSFIQLNNNTLEMFYNTNTRITDFIITDDSEKEHYITYKVLDDASALEPQKEQHYIVIEIFALYMLICVYALSSVQHFKLKEIIKPEYYFGCSLREKLRSSKLKTCKKTKLDETENN